MLSTAQRRIQSKQKMEEEKKKKEQMEAAAVYEQFVESFSETPTTVKTFVRGAIINPDEKTAERAKNEGRMYKPPGNLSKLAQQNDSARKSRESEEKKAKRELKAIKKKEQDKKKSNLELFKEELKSIQKEREERQKMRRSLKDMAVRATRFDCVDSESLEGQNPDLNFLALDSLKGD